MMHGAEVRQDPANGFLMTDGVISVRAFPLPIATNEAQDFESYRGAAGARDQLLREAERLRESADRLQQAGCGIQAELTRKRAIGMEQAAADLQDVLSGHEERHPGYRRQLKAERKREAALAQADAARAKPLRDLDANLVFDRRTAGGSREIRLGNAKGKGEAQVTLAAYATLIRDPKERTEARLRAMEKFDDLWHRAEAGLYPEPRFEPAVDTSAGASGVTAHRMDGLAEMQRLTAYIGRQAQALLWMRVVDRQEFTAIARVTGRDARDVSALVVSAIDSVAAFYGFGRPAPEVQRLDAAQAHASLHLGPIVRTAVSATPSSVHEDDRLRCPRDGRPPSIIE
ncbi:hypothetical protein [Methylobacterium sp. 17Sr1-1]|uniref:hypothetical protein n=1 Tax=Methylobacterium sp. 17Sr1-1 TaxID=2202826 RepID=UPI00195165DB|nr:hypothetical protein [Methylobacterium sp. 17Sr1-1]